MKKKPALFRIVVLLLMALLFLAAGRSGAAVAAEALWLSSSPPANHNPENHGNKQGGGGRQHESEHRPQPLRTYWLNTCGITEAAKAYVLRPEGDYEAVPLQRQEHEVSLAIKTPMGDGPAHGANNIYLVDQYVQDDALVVNTAKWLTIHHNCGWGHDHKFNDKRLRPQSLSEVPLEIVVDDLWDGNFHSNVMSGDTIALAVLSYGKPANGAVVTVVSEKGWQKQLTTDKDGKASFQMIRDYYPEAWPFFKRDQPGKLKLSAVYATAQHGTYEGTAYNKERMTSTFAWRYFPARQEYVSYGYGLAIATFFFAMSGFGVFLFRNRRQKTYRAIEFDE